MRDNGYYEFKCSLGHESKYILQNQKFEILFEIGGHAILDGYYREAISSFTSSLERFYEFAIRVILESVTESDNLFQSVWRSMNNQSERQFGAFVALWATNFREPPNLLSLSSVNFRNKVIHKGKVPTREEAIDYGNSIIKVVVPNMVFLREKFPEAVGKAIHYHQKEAMLCQASWEKELYSFFGFKTIVCLANYSPTYECKNLEDHLIRLRLMRTLNTNR